MASYHDSYDSRTRSSRRNDAYRQPPSDTYLAPAVGANQPRRVRVGQEDQRDPYRSQRSPNRYAYDGRDPRYDYPPPLPPQTGRPRREPSPRVRKRRSWPPPPTCEDEATSLAREAGSQKLLRELGKDVVPSRGTIDQEPMIEDVPEYINRDERRFVLREQRSTDQPTPPTSEDEKARRKARRRPSARLNINLDKLDTKVPEMNKRTASPYAFSKSSQKIKEEVHGGRYLSPEDLLSPPPTDSSSRNAIGTSRSQPSSPRRDSARYSPPSRPNHDYFSLAGGSAIEEEDFDTKSKANSKPSTWPPSRADGANTSPQTSIVDFAPAPAPAPAASSASIRKRNLDARRNTDSDGTLPTLQRFNVDKSLRPSPLTTSALSGLAVPMVSSPQATMSTSEYPRPRSRESSYVTSRGPSPAGSAVAGSDYGAIQPSPRVSSDGWRDDAYYERPPTRESSVSSSRPQSPSPRTPMESPRLPKTDLDWSTLLAMNASRRSAAPSRLFNNIPQDSTPPPSRGYSRPSGPVGRVDSLPYPMDDGPSTPTVWMPSEKKHQFFPDPKTTSQQPPVQDAKAPTRSAIPGPANKSYGSSSTARPTRPAFPTRHSTADLPPTSKQQPPEQPRANESRSRRTAAVAAVPSSQMKKELQSLAKKPFPECSRKRPVEGYSDWYTLIGAPNLEFCPDCVSDVFDRTIYRNMFRRSPPRNLDDAVRCSLGGKPWIRLAWLMTLDQQRMDLRLLEDLAEIEETSTPCSGDEHSARTWYGLRDKHGAFLKDFRVCYSDVRKIEALLPTLNGMFVRLPQRTADEVGLCAIRPEGSRFSIYLDALMTTHEKALANKRDPNPGPFISLVQWRSRLRECTKDTLIRNGLWHFAPTCPELTVCEDCFATVIEPEIERNSDIAMRFNQTIQPVYGEGIGSSCQLYSPRMRKVFDRAVHKRDFNYLAKEAKERRKAELRLQEEYKRVLQKAKRVSWGSVDSQDDERRLDDTITRITNEWKKYWE